MDLFLPVVVRELWQRTVVSATTMWAVTVIRNLDQVVGVDRRETGFVMQKQLISRLSHPTQAQMGETVRSVDLLFGQTYTAPSRPYPGQFPISNCWGCFTVFHYQFPCCSREILFAFWSAQGSAIWKSRLQEKP